MLQGRLGSTTTQFTLIIAMNNKAVFHIHFDRSLLHKLFRLFCSQDRFLRQSAVLQTYLTATYVP